MNDSQKELINERIKHLKHRLEDRINGKEELEESLKKYDECIKETMLKIKLLEEDL